MTYEDYKNRKNNKNKKNYFNAFLSKLFTIIIFTMTIVIISNLSNSFRSFIIDNVLNATFDFSNFNKIVNKTTNIFKNNEVMQVSSEIKDEEGEKYLDGIKYKIGENEKIYLKNSGIVTFIGKKDGYKNTIIVQQSNGYYAWYGNIKESVKLYDYVEAGSEIGTSSKEYYYVLLKDDKPIDYESQN